jgi:hypothetical protein
MFMMPRKQKKAILSQDGEDSYTLSFAMLELDDNEFNRMVHEDVLECLNDVGGSLADTSLETQSVRFKTQDIKAFRLSLIRRSYFLQV